MAQITATEAGDVVLVTMPRAHALILEDVLSRYELRWEEVVDHAAEQAVFWYLQAALEAVLEDEIRDPRYDEHLRRARERVHESAS